VGVSINVIFMLSNLRLKAPASLIYIRRITISTFDFIHHIEARGVGECILVDFNKFASFI